MPDSTICCLLHVRRWRRAAERVVARELLCLNNTEIIVSIFKHFVNKLGVAPQE